MRVRSGGNACDHDAADPAWFLLTLAIHRSSGGTAENDELFLATTEVLALDQITLSRVT